MKKFFLVILFSVFFWPFSASAFSVSPSRTLLTIDPGASAIVAVNIGNESDKKKIYQLDTLSFFQNEKGQTIYEDNVSQAENWAVPVLKQATLNSHETKEVAFEIKAPKNAPAGSYYLALAVKESAAQEGEIGVGGQIVSLLTLQVAGDITEKLEIKKASSAKSLYFQKPWLAELSLKNLTPVEVPIKGKIYLKDPMGELIAYEDLPLGSDILANSERRIQVSLWENERLVLPGIYRLHFVIDYGKTNAQVDREIRVWYVPEWLAIGGPGFLILFIGLVVLKRYSKKRNV